MFADGVDLRDGRAGMHQRPIGGDKILQRNRVGNGLLDQGRAAAAQHKDDEIPGRQRFDGAQHRLRGLHRILVRQRVSALVVAEPEDLGSRQHRTAGKARNADSGAEAFAERLHHGVRSLADCHHEDSRERIDVV